ncbi:Proteinkinasesubdomain-containing proteinPKL ccin9, partial [Favolaschia claudopus]
LRHIANVPQSEIELWKPNPPISFRNVETTLASAPIAELATKIPFDADIASEIMPNNEGFVDILVLDRRRRPSDFDPEGEDTVSDMIERYNSLRRKAQASKPPSTLAKSTEYRAWQRGECPIYDGRYHSDTPTATVGPPVELYHAGFAKFIDESSPSSSLNLPDTFVCEVSHFMHTVAGIYKDESAFSAKVTPLLQGILGRGILRIVNSDLTSPDAAVLSDRLKILALAEYKRELGEGGCDASTQASLSVVRYWTQPENKGVAALSCCPTYVVAVGGPWLAILGAVITSRCIVQRFTDFMWLGPRNALANNDHVRQVARVLFALKGALADSQLFQDSLPISPPISDEPLPSRFFPHVTSYVAEGSQEKYFKYVAPLERDPTCVTFHCRALEDDADIVVKFVRSYGEAAHRLLAGRGLAPQLLYCGLVDAAASYSGIKMVVMGFVAGKTLSWLKMKQVIPQHLGDELASILDVLHRAGFVYGDLREPNIMLTDDAKKVQLVDFDWAGKVGEACYPISLSKSVQWPPGCHGLGLITQAHDMYMLAQMRGQL